MMPYDMCKTGPLKQLLNVDSLQGRQSHLLATP